MNTTTKSVDLDTPIIRGEQEITSVTVRKPQSGELRGTSLPSILGMDYTALELVLPRITQPALTAKDIREMDPADLCQIGTELSFFLVPRRAKEGFPNE